LIDVGAIFILRVCPTSDNLKIQLEPQDFQHFSISTHVSPQSEADGSHEIERDRDFNSITPNSGEE
jgi:hypothetical protein